MELNDGKQANKESADTSCLIVRTASGTGGGVAHKELARRVGTGTRTQCTRLRSSLLI